MIEILQKHRFSSSFSDFVTRYTAVSSTNLRTQTSEYYALETDDGLTMNLGVNPLLQFGLEETRSELCGNILTALSAVNYVPFDSDTIGNPALDLGDVLTFSGGQADAQQITCVTSFTVKIGGRQSLKCVGKNPRLSQAKSKNDKNISGLLNQIEAGKIGIHTFTNASEYTIGETDVRIISIEFASKEENHAQFFGQVVVDVEAQAAKKSAHASGTIVIPFPSPGSGAEEGNAGTGDGPSGTEPEAGDADDGAAGEETMDISVDVSLPVTWMEDGKAVCYVTFELNNTEILLHHRRRPGTAGNTSCLCITPLKISCRTLPTPLMCICGWRTAPAAWGSETASLPSVARPWRLRRPGTAGSTLRKRRHYFLSAAAFRQGALRRQSMWGRWNWYRKAMRIL